MIALRNLAKAAVVSAVAISALAATAGSAGAAVVCNRWGECWHTHHHWAYPGGGYVWHSDDWYFHRQWGSGPYRWHDWRGGRGYWRNGVWVTF